jgi:hypothetical protein
MVVAMLALFVTMGGTTYAVANLPKRSVGSPELKKGAVRSENIASHAVTSSKLGKGLVSSGNSAPSGPGAPPIVLQVIPSDSVGYADAAGYASAAGSAGQASLVDRAKLADKATTATGATSATSAGSAADADTLDGKDQTAFLSRSAFVDLPRFFLTNGQTRVIFASGPFQLTARCSINTLGVDKVTVTTTSSEDHAALDGDVTAPDLTSSSPESDRYFAYDETLTGVPTFKASNDGTLIAPAGSEVRSIVIYTGINIFGQKGRCYFGGLAAV